MKCLLGAVVLLFACSCGYRSLESPSLDKEKVTISVPNILKDGRGLLNMALVRALGDSGHFEPRQNEGRYRLEVDLSDDVFDRMGFRYDRDPSGELRNNLVGTENRRIVTGTIRLIDTLSEKIVVGPSKVSADLVYDYVDPDNLYDLSFVNPEGVRLKVINVSLGQLDSVEGAQDASASELYSKFAEKIVNGLISQRW